MLAETVAPAILGRPLPRIAPPRPARSDIAGFRLAAEQAKVDLMPWQEEAACYLCALAADDRHLFREIAIVVARQNGKSTLLVPLIVQRLLAGQRVMHTAQDRRLPLEVFEQVADVIEPSLFKMRNGRQRRPRFANGQEEISLANGGLYTIVAPTRGGARGPSRDLVIVDELREMDAWDFIAAAKPTLTASKNPQMLYLSNAGDDSSVVLNALRDRAGTDPRLAYLEWSADPDRSDDDPDGWAEANPGMGYERGEMGSIHETLVDDYRTAKLEGTLALFETEHLCRWVKTMRPALVSSEQWAACETSRMSRPRKQHLAVSMDPDGSRASAAVAYLGEDGLCYLTVVEDVKGSPIRTSLVGQELRTLAAERRIVTKVGYDSLTDAELAKHFKATKPIVGMEFANATSNFVRLVEAGELRWKDAQAVGDDLTWTARKENDETGSYQAVRANDDRPITATLAAIRAVYLATGIRLASSLRVY